MGVLYARVGGAWEQISVGGGVQSVVAGTGITVNAADPTKPIVATVPPYMGTIVGIGGDWPGPARTGIAMLGVPASSRTDRVAVVSANVLCTPLAPGETDIDITDANTGQVIARSRGGGGQVSWTASPTAVIAVPAIGVSLGLGITPSGGHSTRTYLDTSFNYLHVVVY